MIYLCVSQPDGVSVFTQFSAVRSPELYNELIFNQ